MAASTLAAGVGKLVNAFRASGAPAETLFLLFFIEDLFLDRR